MRIRVSWVALAAACLVWLAGCETTSTTNPFVKLDGLFKPAEPTLPESDTTGTIVKPEAPPGAPPVKPELLGNDPNDDLSIAKKYFNQGSYGLAERHYRKTVEARPRDAEGWLGLAASYDRLKRFDLADRAYGQTIKIVGPIPEVLNNQGFSYMLRGDYKRARTTLLAAKAKDPNSPYIANNLKLLDESEHKAKGIN